MVTFRCVHSCYVSLVQQQQQHFSTSTWLSGETHPLKNGSNSSIKTRAIWPFRVRSRPFDSRWQGRIGFIWKQNVERKSIIYSAIFLSICALISVLFWMQECIALVCPKWKFHGFDFVFEVVRESPIWIMSLEGICQFAGGKEIEFGVRPKPRRHPKASQLWTNLV